MMKITESELLNRLDSGSKQSYHDYQKGLLKDSDKRAFDTPAVELLEYYSNAPIMLRSELDYLDSLKDENGVPFSRSYRRYSDMESQWEFFLKPDKPSFLWNKHCRTAAEIVQKRYASLRYKLKPLDYSTDRDIYEAVTDWDTSAGWTKVATAGRVHYKRDLFPDNDTPLDKSRVVVKRWEERMAQARADASFNCPILCGVRTQGSGAYDDVGNRTYTCKHKTRAINMYDVDEIIAESIWGKPITERLLSYTYSALGKNDPSLNTWVYQRRSWFRSWISFDYSKYDSTIPAWLIRKAFEIIKSCFLPCKYDGLWDLVVEDFINKNIVTGKGVIYARHGNPSGSRFTAIINGICNEIITETWLQMLKLAGDYVIMGDDNLVYLDKAVDPSLVEEICSYISYNFGIQANADKTMFGQNVDNAKFMSRYWTVDGPDRCDGEVISLLAYPEGERSYWKKSSGMSPAVVLFSYVLCYPIAMKRLMKVDQFLRDTNLTFSGFPRTKEALRELPYNVRTYLEGKR